MKSDVEIAQEARLERIEVIAEKAGLLADEIEPYGRNKAKVSLTAMERLQGRTSGKLVLVTAINPTAAGEGKTTVTIGLGQALNRIGKKRSSHCGAQPGPRFGVKGGATGGGYSPGGAYGGYQSSLYRGYPRRQHRPQPLADLICNSYYFGNSWGISPTPDYLAAGCGPE